MNAAERHPVVKRDAFFVPKNVLKVLICMQGIIHDRRNHITYIVNFET